MRALVFILLLSVVGLRAYTQNLVPNPSFETYTGCPGGNSAISNGLVASWNRPPGSIITPDLFTPCTTSGTSCSDFNTANNCVGSSAAFHGTAYAGFLWYYTGAPNLKEYIQAQLTSLCLSGTVYRASYRTKLGNLCRYGTNHLGLYISAAAPSQPSGNLPILVVPTVERAGQVLDKVNWTPVSGTFTSNGTERYITIGNFYNDASTNIFNFGSSAGVCAFATGGAYYMVDSVIVQPASVLPVTVAYFEGSNQSLGHQLNWEVAQATVLGELWLEHGTDGEHFSMVAQWMHPAADALKGGYLNAAPAEGWNYYRLGMADRNGEFMVSEIVALDYKAHGAIQFQLQPNPADRQATVSFQLPADAKDYTVKVFALNGAELFAEQVEDAAFQVEHVLPTAALQAGVYMVVVSSADRRGVRKLVVVH